MSVAVRPISASCRQQCNCSANPLPSLARRRVETCVTGYRQELKGTYQRGQFTLVRAATTFEVHPSAPDLDIEQLKKNLLSQLASADRGLAASKEIAEEVDRLAKQLEQASGPVIFTWDAADAEAVEPALSLLNGKWRLVYSSGFVDGSLGGQHPGPPAALSPFTLGQVYQTISAYIGKLDNVVELYFKYNIPSLPNVPAQVPVVTATLQHSFETYGSNTVQITFEDTSVKATGGLNNFLDSVPSLAIPQLPEPLRPPKQFRSAKFDVTYLDSEMRITRGDRSELRIYLRP